MSKNFDSMGISKRVLLACAAVAVAALAPPGGAALAADARPVPAPRIAFHFADFGDIYTIRPDGSGLRRLTTDAGIDESPSWSPDRTRIAYICNGSRFAYGPGDICVIHLATREVQVLTPGRAHDYGPEWSPDGKRIVFERMVAAGDPQTQPSRDSSPNSEIFVMRADGSRIKRLTFSAGVDEAATWAPDGGTIAFTSYRLGNPDVWIMNSDGSLQRPLSTYPLRDSSPAWSPDGSVIAFTRDVPKDAGPFADPQLWTMDPVTGAASPLGNGISGYLPEWSPDGRTIIYTDLIRNSAAGLFAVDADGSRPRRLYFDGRWIVAPAWRR